MIPNSRLSRNRSSEGLRRLAQETNISPDDLILPLFVVEGQNRLEPIPSMPGVSRFSVDQLLQHAQTLHVGTVLLFGVPETNHKDDIGTYALQENSIVPAAIRSLKTHRPEITIITDVCLCGYTTHGHCGILTDSGKIDMEKSCEQLSRMAVVHAQAGADMVAPSAMTDGQVAAIRQGLDHAHLPDTPIMAYASKFASAFYGPFRDAAHSAPQFGDRRSYQLPPGNRREALREALQDAAEGADWLMVKPALPYLDVLKELRDATPLPLAAYQVSGEYAMLKFAAQAGALDEPAAALEALLCLKRAGADALITYYAQEILQYLPR